MGVYWKDSSELKFTDQIIAPLPVLCNPSAEMARSGLKQTLRQTYTCTCSFEFVCGNGWMWRETDTKSKSNWSTNNWFSWVLCWISSSARRVSLRGSIMRRSNTVASPLFLSWLDLWPQHWENIIQCQWKVPARNETGIVPSPPMCRHLKVCLLMLPTCTPEIAESKGQTSLDLIRLLVLAKSIPMGQGLRILHRKNFILTFKSRIKWSVQSYSVMPTNGLSPGSRYVNHTIYGSS